MEFDNSKHLLNFDVMDNKHKEFIEIYNSLEGESTQDYINVMMKIFEDTKLHFSQEEDLMLKYKYPRLNEHTNEHKKVLYEMEYFINKSSTAIGKLMLKSYYLQALPSWFDSHLLSMDSDLSNFLSAKIL
ncbi:MAG: hemerythrin [Sulfurimonas sp.]|jgi:hemerythrin